MQVGVRGGRHARGAADIRDELAPFSDIKAAPLAFVHSLIIVFIRVPAARPLCQQNARKFLDPLPLGINAAFAPHPRQPRAVLCTQRGQPKLREHGADRYVDAIPCLPFSSALLLDWNIVL